MREFADGYFVCKDELVKKINLYLAWLNLATATPRYVESQISPIPPAIYSTAMELKITGTGKRKRNIISSQT